MSRSRYTGVKLARSEGAATVRGIRATCREARTRLTEDARGRRLALREAIQGERVALRGSCSMRLDDARAATARAIEEARHSAMELDKLRKVTRSPAQNLAAERARLRGAERIRESDDEVRRNLPDDLALVWAKVKGRIKGTARTTRTERFLDWVHDHPADAARIVNDAAEQAYPQEETEAQYLARRQSETRPEWEGPAPRRIPIPPELERFHDEPHPEETMLRRQNRRRAARARRADVSDVPF